MRKSAIVAVFSAFTLMAMTYQNCGRHNPATISDAPIEQLGYLVEGKSFLINRVLLSDGSEYLFNQNKQESLDITLEFTSSREIHGSDGCNNFFGSLFWHPKAHPEDPKVLEIFDATSTLKGCIPPPTVTFPVTGEYYFELTEDRLQLMEVKSNTLYDFSQLQDLTP